MGKSLPLGALLYENQPALSTTNLSLHITQAKAKNTLSVSATCT